MKILLERVEMPLKHVLVTLDFSRMRFFQKVPATAKGPVIYIYIYILESLGRASRGLDSVKGRAERP